MINHGPKVWAGPIRDLMTTNPTTLPHTALVRDAVRIVRERRGIHRRPEPKLLAGSNFADVSFDLDSNTGRVVALCAIDNLMKGAAGNAMQCLNLMLGLDERAGLDFPGLHPI